MFRTCLSALIAAAACAPLFAAPAFDELSGNTADMPMDTLTHGSRLVRAFVPAVNGEIGRVDVKLSFDAPVGQLVATLLASDNDFMPGATMGKADTEIVGGQQDVSLEFPAGVALVAGQNYFMMLTADADFAWLGDLGADGRLLCADTGQAWAEVSGFRAAMAVETADPAIVEPAQPQPPVVPAVTPAVVSIARTARVQDMAMGEINPQGDIAGFEVLAVLPGLRISRLRLEGLAILADIHALDVATEGANFACLAMNMGDGTQVTFVVTIVVGPNAAPVLSGPSDMTVAMNSDTWMPLFAQDAEQSYTSLTVAFEVDNPALLDPATGIEMFAKLNGMVITPRAGHVGIVRIAVTAVDAGGLAAKVEFTLTVGEMQSQLWIAQIGEQVILADGGMQAIALEVLNFAGTGGEVPAAYALDHAILPMESITAGGADGAFALLISAPAGNTGATMVIVTFTSGEVTATMAFRAVLADSMILAAQAPQAAPQDSDFEGGCSAGAGSGLAALALAGLPMVFRRRK